MNKGLARSVVRPSVRHCRVSGTAVLLWFGKKLRAIRHAMTRPPGAGSADNRTPPRAAGGSAWGGGGPVAFLMTRPDLIDIGCGIGYCRHFVSFAEYPSACMCNNRAVGGNCGGIFFSGRLRVIHLSFSLSLSLSLSSFVYFKLQGGAAP